MSYSIDKHNKRKDILWKKDKSKFEQFKINFKVAWRRFDTQTHGQGLYLIMLMLMITLVLVLTNVLPTVFKAQQTIEEKHLKDQLVCMKYGGCLNNV